MRNLGRDFGTIVEQRLKELGKRPFTVETEANLPSDSIRNVIRAENPSGPTLSKVQQICDALGLELYIGLPRDIEPVPSVDKFDEDFVHVPFHSALLAAGYGIDGIDDQAGEQVAFRKTWLRKMGVSASNAALVRAHGDSMTPAIQSGDLLLIDSSKTDVPIRQRAAKDTRPAPIYAVLSDGAARVKRIERPQTDIVMLVSDNPAYSPELLTGAKARSLKVIGKVLWWGHTNRE
jgi:phage repressor protein C with HTH and peptisase S24 domain